MNAIKQYSKYLKKMKAAEEILKELKAQVLRELRKYPDGKAIVDDVEYHLTKKTETKYATEVEERMKELRKLIEKIKEGEKEAGRAVTTEKETFDAYIPKSNLENVLGSVTDYKNFFRR